MDRLDAMRAFLAIADRGGFVSAARALRLSPASATRAVAMLEKDLGLALFNRTTRAVRLTESGVVYAEYCRRILGDVEAARGAVRGENATPRGILAVTAPVLFGRLHVMPIAETLASAHPDLSVRLTLVDRVTHLVEEGFDVAVRIGALADSALIAAKVGEVRRVVVASPDYVRLNGVPLKPADLKHHRIVSFDGVGFTDEWRFGVQEQTVVKVTPSLSVNVAEAARDAVERGQGIARLLSYQVQAGVAAGRLQPLLTQDEPKPFPVSLVFQASRRASANIQAFIAEAVRYFAASSSAF